MHALDSLFDQFIRERTYVKNVTPKTRDWYRSAWAAFKASRPSFASRGTDVLITRSDLTCFVVHLRERGVKPISCNTWLRAINAFCRWLYAEGKTTKLETLVRRDAMMKMKTMRQTLVCLLGVVLGALSCNSPTAPTKPMFVAIIRDIRYEHVSNISIQSDTRVELEFWDCSLAGLLPGLRGPDVCLLKADADGVYRCPMSNYMQRVATSCDSGIDVFLRTASGNPFLKIAHDIYLNGTKVSRFTTNTSSDYPIEGGVFGIDAAGKIH